MQSMLIEMLAFGFIERVGLASAVASGRAARSMWWSVVIELSFCNWAE